MTGTSVTQSGGVQDVLDQTDELLAAGRGREAVDLLVETHRRTGEAGLEERLVQVRHSAFPSSVATSEPSPLPQTWPAPLPDPVEEVGIPEVSGEDLTADLVSAALQHRGSLLVRGLLSRPVADELLATVQLLFNQLSLHRTGVDASMTKDRIAIESWFFAPSTYPDAQVPIVF